MKKLLGILLVTAVALFSGCKTVPTVERMYATSYSIGIATGMVANQTKIDDKSRNAVVEIVNVVVSCIPETNQTFEVAWTPIAQAHTDKLVAEGKLDKAQGVLVMSAFSLAVKGIDYVFEVRFPKAKTYKELVSSSIDGFSGGFLCVFKPVDAAVKAPYGIEYDVEAYEWLRSH